MSIQRNLRDGNIKAQQRKAKRAEKSPATNNAAIGRDGLLVYDGGVITIENGGLDVTGTATISGVLNVSGQTTLSGVTTIAGPTGIVGALTIAGDTNITGATSISGDTDISGALSIDGPLDVTGTTTLAGATTLSNNLTVTAGGSIKAGNLEIEPAGGGQINFLNGSIAASTTFGLGIVHTVGVQISSPNTKLTDLPTKTGVTSNIYIDNAGRLWKVG